MHAILVLMLFGAYALIVHGIYEEKLRTAAKQDRVEYRFLPRTLLDEQLGGTSNLLGDFKSMFEGPVSSPWEYANIGRDSGTDTHTKKLGAKTGDTV